MGKDLRKRKKPAGTVCSVVLMVVFLVACVASPFVVNLLFQHEAPSYELGARWSPGELLTYIGSSLACAGTLVLGGLSLHQNRLFREESDRRLDAERKRLEESCRPAFFIEQNGSNSLGINIALKNASLFPSRDIVLSDTRGVDKEGITVWWVDDCCISLLGAGEEGNLVIGSGTEGICIARDSLDHVESGLSCKGLLGYGYSFRVLGTFEESSYSNLIVLSVGWYSFCARVH